MSIPPIAPYPMPTAGELVPAPVDWWPDPARAVLLVHDMQRYFVDAFPAGQSPATELVGNLRRLRSAARAARMPVVYSVQPGGMARTERGLLHDVWGPGMTREPRHRSVIAALAPAPGDHVVTKYRYSAFFRTRLRDLLETLGRDQLVVGGVFAHIGCLFTVGDAFAHDIEPFLVADAVADFTREDHLMALGYAARRCAVTMTTDHLVAALATGRPAPPATLSPASGRSAAGGS